MIRRFSPLVLSVQFLADLVLTLLAAKLAELLRLHVVIGLERREQFVGVQPDVYMAVLSVWAFFFLLLGVFDYRRRLTLTSDLTSLFLAITLSMLVLASFFYFLAIVPPAAPSRLFYLYFYVIDLIMLGAFHAGVYSLFTLARRHGRNVRRVLLVGSGVQGRHVAVRLRGREAVGVALVGYVCDQSEEEIPGVQRLGATGDLYGLVTRESIDEVVIALPAERHQETLDVALRMEEQGLRVRILPDVFEMVAMKARVEDFHGLPLISIQEPSIGPVQAGVKRLFDVIIAGVLLVPLTPLMGLIALWIRLDSPGPALIHQRRIGIHGIPFYVHKFRTMHWNPDDVNRGGEKVKNDPRVTGAGRFLRRTSLDELPQLWNVMKGEMSLVGPRPELPALVEKYEPWQRKRLNVPPGMTGWWQVNGRSDLPMHMNTEIDLFYVQNYSILLDVQILLRTLGAVIRGRGAF